MRYSGYKNSKIVILPAAYENTTTYIRGAAKGPQAIIEASAYMELYDEELGGEAYKAGICVLRQPKLKKSQNFMVRALKKSVEKILDDGKFPVILGGEHSITIGSVKAIKEKYKDVSVLYLDAHADLKDYCGGKDSNPCVARRVLEMCPVVGVGIRSLNTKEADLIRQKNLDIFFAKDIADNSRWIKRAIGRLSGQVYITIDLDVLDPAVMPSVGTPEPGGMDWYGLTNFLKEVAKEREIVGFDIVELCPKKGFEYADFTAAKLCYKLISYSSQKKMAIR